MVGLAALVPAAAQEAPAVAANRTDLDCLEWICTKLEKTQWSGGEVRKDRITRLNDVHV